MIEEKVRTEIEELHKFFVGWFSGSLAIGSLDSEFLARMDPEFHLIAPAGILLSLNELTDSLKTSYAASPELRITIRNVQVRRVLANGIIATYEEWQTNALASSSSDNARISTVVFKKDKALQWLHVHETWMSAIVQSAGSCDF